MSSGVGSVAFVVAIVVAVMLHEWGHYATARRFGMRAERFFFGFGPTLWSTRRGETEYGVKAFPLGGFVRVVGMSITDVRQRPVADAVFDSDAVHADRRALAEETGTILDHVPAVPDRTLQRLDEELTARGTPRRLRAPLVSAASTVAAEGASAHEVAFAFQDAAQAQLPPSRGIGDIRHRILLGDEGRFFHDRPAWQCAIVLVAGSGMHFVQAIVLLFIGFWVFGTFAVPTVSELMPTSPAAEAGLRPGDTIVAIDGQPVDEFADAKAVIESSAGRSVTLEVERAGDRIQIELVPALTMGFVFSDTELADAGFFTGDRIVAVGEQPVASLDDVHRAAAGDAARDVTVLRFDPEAEDSERLVLEGVPAATLAALDEDQVAGVAGFVPAQEGLSAAQALGETFKTGEGLVRFVPGIPAMVTNTFRGIGMVFGPEGIASLVRQVGGDERDPMGGQSIVGVTVLAGQVAAEGGIFDLLLIVVVLNVFVGILNLVPLPPLDGGHLAVLGVESVVNLVRRVRGRPGDYRVDPRTVTAVAIPVLVVLGVVFFSLVFLDVTNPIRLPG